MFYNAKRKHTNNGMLSPADFEFRQKTMNKAGVWKTLGTSALGMKNTHFHKLKVSIKPEDLQ